MKESERVVEKAIEDIRNGKMVILMDDKQRENEGDLCMAAEKITPEAIAFMATCGRGLICLALTEKRTRTLNLPLMVRDNRSRFGTNFTISIDARDGIATGISASDRAKTILTAVSRDSGPEDLVSPGHRFRVPGGGFWKGPARPKAPLTLPGSPDCTRPGSSARS
jgi:3,4-dihydroxy 2-butanone 4-phosphate synthase/GTP cyclohydrolase II